MLLQLACRERHGAWQYACMRIYASCYGLLVTHALTCLQFDLNSVAERPDQLARPYLHHMLAAVYPHYDIVIWSATSMKWIEVKMRELRVSNHPDFKITCFMDSNSMLSVCDKKGKHSWAMLCTTALSCLCATEM